MSCTLENNIQNTKSNLIIESDLVLDNLDNIIDAHSSHAKNLLIKKSESFKKLHKDNLLQKALSTNLDPSANLPNESTQIHNLTKRDKIKSKSYLIHNPSTSSNSSRKSSESKENTNSTSSSGSTSNLKRFLFSNSSSNTISGTKTKKLSSLIVNSPTTSQNPYSTTTTNCFLNTTSSKKKRSSLFNLFSFSKNSNSNSSNAATPTSGTNQSVQNLNSLSYDSPCGSLVEPESIINPDDDNVFLEYSSEVPPPPEEFADQPGANKNRPFSELVSTPEWHRNFRFFLNKKTYKISNTKLEKSDSLSKSSENKLEKSSLLSFKTNDCLNEKDKSEPLKLNKKPSIRSKGFSIPLNASYCPNSLPINCVQEHFLINNNQIDDERTMDIYEDLMANENIQDEDSKLKEDFDLVEDNSCLKEVNLRLKYAEIKNLDDEFNDEKSDLKETTTSSTNQDTDQTHETLRNSSTENNTTNTSSSSNNQELNPSLSPTPSILTLSLNNQCSTATTTLNENLNSINFVDNLNLNMFSQQQQQQQAASSNRSKPNISKIMVNYQDTGDTQEKDDSNSKKKRFQQFQTQSLINLNGQLKNSGPSLDNNNNNNSNSNTSPDSKANSKVNTNFYDTIEEVLSNNKIVKSPSLCSTSSSSTHLNLINNNNTTSNSNTNDDITLAIQSSNQSKPIYLTVQSNKSLKLKDLLTNLIAQHSMNIDDYNLFRKTDQDEFDSEPIDLNTFSDAFSGFEFYLKKKSQKPLEKSSKVRKSSLQIANPDDLEELKLNNSSQSSLNWQNYFNPKTIKERNNKQKRNSCIAVMNDFSSSTNASINNQNQNHNNSGHQAPLINLATSSSTSITSNMRDSVSSFQNFVFSNSTGAMSPGTSPNDGIMRPNRKFRRIAQISSIFTSYNQSRQEMADSRLSDQLNSFLRELPKLPDELNVKTFDSTILDIEPDWNKFVGELFAQSLPIKLAKQQMAIWELLVTECSHIKTTKIIIDVFLSCLINLKCSEQTSDLLKDIDIKKLFCNITDVFNCNLTFWQKYLNPIVVNLNQTNMNSNTNLIIDPSLLIKAFSEFKTLFAPYEEFILERNYSTEYFKQKLNENEHFAKFIQWAENHPLVGRLKISDFMMIPVQRLTKYQLLIENIYQHTEEEPKREKIALIKEWVNSLPNSINIKLSYLAQFNDISESIEKYEGITGPNDEVAEILSTFKKFDIKSPLPGCAKSSVRELIHQGPLKLKDLPKSLDVHCFLFTDMLLITQQKKTKKYKIIKPPVSTNRMIVKELTQTDKAFVVISVNDYNVPDSVCMFISNQSKKWIEFLELSKRKYIEELDKHKNSNSVQQILNNFSFENAKCQQQSSVSSSSSPPESPRRLTINSSSSLTGANNTIHENDSANNSCSESNDTSTVNDDKQFTSSESTSPNKRRDSSATLTLSDNMPIDQNSLEDGGAIKTNAIKSPLLSKRLHKSSQLHQYQQKQINQNGPARLLDRRIERQRRNMTDPNQHSNDERHLIITKRNSLNDKSNKNQPLTLHPKLTNLYGDSTSTILSTDSGVSNCDNQISFSQESIVKQSPSKILNPLLKNVLSPSSPTSSSYSNSSNDPIYSNLSISSSSSSNCSTKFDSFNSKKTFKPSLTIGDEDYYEDDDLIADEDRVSVNNLEINEPELESNSFTSVYDHPNTLMFKKMPNFRLKQQNNTIENIKLIKPNFDMNNNQTYMFHSGSDYYDYVNRTNDDDLINKNETQKLISNSSTPSSSTSSANGLYQKSQSTDSARISLKKPLIKIKPTTVKNESVRIKPELILTNDPKALNFDPTIESAQLNFNSNSSGNGLSLDNHHRMILVNLLHTTLDAT